MISSRDIQVFFNMLDVIANPERAKQALEELQQRTDALDKRVIEVQHKEEVAEKKSQEADGIIASKQAIDTMHQDKSVQLVKQQGTLEKLAEINDAMKKELDHRHSILSELGDKLREKEAKLKEWEEAIYNKEQSYVKKAEQLAKSVKEHAEKVLHLKSLV